MRLKHAREKKKTELENLRLDPNGRVNGKSLAPVAGPATVKQEYWREVPQFARVDRDHMVMADDEAPGFGPAPTEFHKPDIGAMNGFMTEVDDGEEWDVTKHWAPSVAMAKGRYGAMSKMQLDKKKRVDALLLARSGGEWKSWPAEEFVPHFDHRSNQLTRVRVAKAETRDHVGNWVKDGKGGFRWET